MSSRPSGVVPLLLLVHLAAAGVSARPLVVCDSQVPPASMNPLRILEWKPEVLISHVLDGLLGFDPEGGLVPRLARSWEWVDPLHLRLHLRQGTRFHDGTPFDATVVAWYFRTLRAPGSTGPRGFLFETVKGVEVVDPHTVVLELEQPDGVLLHKLAAFSWQIPPREPGTEAWERLTREPVGTGPYRLREWRADGALVLDANLDHFDGVPAFPDGIVFRFLPEPDQIAGLIDGSLDLLGAVRPLYHARIQEAPGCRILVHDALVSVTLVFNTLASRARDVRIRQAVALAVNVEDLIRYVARGNGRAVCGSALPGQVGHDARRRCPEFDPEEARRLLGEVAPGGRIRLRGLLEPEFELLGKSLRVQLAKVGIDLDLERVTRERLLERIAQPKGTGGPPWDGDLFVFSCPDPTYHSYFLARIGNRRQGSWSLWEDAEYDALLDRMTRSGDPEEVRRLRRELDDLLIRERPVVPLYQVKKGYGVSDHLDFRPTRSGMLDLRACHPARQGRGEGARGVDAPPRPAEPPLELPAEEAP